MRPSLMQAGLLATWASRPGSVAAPSLGAFDPLQHGQGSLTPGASPRTMGDLEGGAFRSLQPAPRNPGLAPGVSGCPVLERAHGLVERVALHRLLPRSADQ